MHIVYHIIKLDDETSTASEIEEFEMETDEGIFDDTKKKSMHKRNVSREVVPSPQVSDVVKYSRSTLVFKSPEQQA
jgi:hypothetical protein